MCQILSIDGDREGNFRRIEYALETAKAAGANIATFPESVILGWENPDAHRLATPIPGADSDRIAALAKKYGLMISFPMVGRRRSRSGRVTRKPWRISWCGAPNSGACRSWPRIWSG